MLHQRAIDPLELWRGIDDAIWREAARAFAGPARPVPIPAPTRPATGPATGPAARPAEPPPQASVPARVTEPA